MEQDIECITQGGKRHMMHSVNTDTRWIQNLSQSNSDQLVFTPPPPHPKTSTHFRGAESSFWTPGDLNISGEFSLDAW